LNILVSPSPNGGGEENKPNRILNDHLKFVFTFCLA